LKLIDESPIGVAVEKRRRLLQYTGEPNRIYIENVRSFFGVPHRIAKAMCELAVRQGFFERCLAVLCPNDERVLIDTCEPNAILPNEISCEVCESLEVERSVFSPGECRTLPFYRVRAVHD